MDSATTRRWPCFLEKNDGLASIAEMGNHYHHMNHNSLISRRNSFKNLYSSSSSSRSSPRLSSGTRLYHTRFEQQVHFLESCFLCNKPLGHNRDIFMYRGDTPFCSEECRQEQIEMDEVKEKQFNLSASIKALRKKDQIKSTTSQNNSAQEYPLCRGSVAAA
ncbi:hypothetical protein FXO38_33074 [Capsicum annuum]|nr:FCS-Like Zinc finger 1 isoform X1 [Capsicum annuum]KAF3619094.1 hypothetical protein FXO38_33074 [Capsicum annuum]